MSDPTCEDVHRPIWKSAKTLRSDVGETYCHLDAEVRHKNFSDISCLFAKLEMLGVAAWSVLIVVK